MTNPQQPQQSLMKEGFTAGPTLDAYIETRFNLLRDVIEGKTDAQRQALGAFIESTRVAAEALKAAQDAAQVATDLRYQQRFEAQSDALAAAFLSQQTAMQTAFTVAEKAVQAALAAADRAVSKAELAADKRFEALNELRQMLNDMVGTMLTRIEALQRFDAVAEKIETQGKRVTDLEGRMNMATGTLSGERNRQMDQRGVIAILIAAAGLLAGILYNIFGR